MGSFEGGGLGAFLREQRRQAKLSLRQLADAAGVSNPYLSQIERGLRKPSAEILQQIAKGLEISAETLYVRAGILDERGHDGADPPDSGESGVRTAVLADPGLTDEQKQALLRIHEAFRHENAAGAGGEKPDTGSSPTEPPVTGS
ncbi:helix-turn-helix domain-containing protein [Streptomyces sp. ST2-7A]|uniref:helix-turn-helix domain-containing protein n=1 Tax=Streptomyces sp. ST2-7A TaxID=2907214 RepID=UPI001F40FF37|nr:helix-turn-helix transcriptional regulator [Streptomyces sp. ST2-7A]MCE7080273.1 helix-turn-helix domain-containing protein [Streptomyces sp. ST2-7A]